MFSVWSVLVRSAVLNHTSQQLHFSPPFFLSSPQPILTEMLNLDEIFVIFRVKSTKPYSSQKYAPSFIELEVGVKRTHHTLLIYADRNRPYILLYNLSDKAIWMNEGGRVGVMAQASSWAHVGNRLNDLGGNTSLARIKLLKYFMINVAAVSSSIWDNCYRGYCRYNYTFGYLSF